MLGGVTGSAWVGRAPERGSQCVPLDRGLMTSSLRIAMLGVRGFATSPPPAFRQGDTLLIGGAELAVEGLSRALARRGHDVTVFTRGGAITGSAHPSPRWAARRLHSKRPRRPRRSGRRYACHASTGSGPLLPDAHPPRSREEHSSGHCRLSRGPPGLAARDRRRW